MKKILIIIFILSVLKNYGQQDSLRASIISEKAFVIDQLNSKLLKTSSFTIDTITVKTKYFKNKVQTMNYFKKSKTSLNIFYYYEDKKIIMIRVEEPSKTVEELARTWEFFFKNDDLIYENKFYNILSGITLDPSQSFDNLPGYNQNIKADFLKSYIFELKTKFKKSYR